MGGCDKWEDAYTLHVIQSMMYNGKSFIQKVISVLFFDVTHILALVPRHPAPSLPKILVLCWA